MYLGRAPAVLPDRSHIVPLADGDALVIHENTSRDDAAGHVAILIHGLGGTHDSAYMRHSAARLLDAGVAVCRVDLRGAGAASVHCARHYHSGCTDDVRSAIGFVRDRYPRAVLSAVGFSLGGAILLGTLAEGERGDARLVDRCLAICPPLDLAAAERRISRSACGAYDRYLAGRLRDQLLAMPRASRFAERVRAGAFRVRGYDEAVTVPMWGFGSVDAYYARCSVAPLLARIEVPTLILGARDDPLVPAPPAAAIAAAPNVKYRLLDHGGHVGFFGARGADPDHRWLHWRILDLARADGG